MLVDTWNMTKDVFQCTMRKTSRLWKGICPADGQKFPWEYYTSRPPITAAMAQQNFIFIAWNELLQSAKWFQSY